MQPTIRALIIILMLLSGCQETETTKHEVVQTSHKVNYSKSNPNKVAFVDSTEQISKIQPHPLQSESKADYELQILLDEAGMFHATANIKITNQSLDKWNELIFYFLPNMFTPENKPDFIQGSSKISMKEILVDGKSTTYVLEQDTLQVNLLEKLPPTKSVNVQVDYTMTVPENGKRFTKINQNYFLAQWYPMLAVYRSGWNKENYHPFGESYHTDFSNFKVHYQVPSGYSVYSTAEDNSTSNQHKGSLKTNGVKEFYLAITKEMNIQSRKVDGTLVRVIGSKGDSTSVELALEVGVASLSYFNKNIGKYPHKELDILVEQSGMEYPGIVAIPPLKGKDTEDEDFFKYVVAHEVAHQWFYSSISSDPYYNPWIDEGITNFASYLFLMDNEKKLPDVLLEPLRKRVLHVDGIGQLSPGNEQLDHYFAGGYSTSVYDQPTLKLWDATGDINSGLSFLKTYYNFYKGKEVDSNELVQFMKAYFKFKDSRFFEDWISEE